MWILGPDTIAICVKREATLFFTPLNYTLTNKAQPKALFGSHRISWLSRYVHTTKPRNREVAKLMLLE